MDFFVAAHGVGNGGACAGERRRVEDDAVEFRDDFLVRTDRGLGFQEIEDVDGLEGALIGESVLLGVTLGGSVGVGALVEGVDLDGAGSRAMQGESAHEAKTVEDLAAIDQLGDELVIALLVEVEAGFVATGNVDVEFETVQFNWHRAFEGTDEDTVGFGESFEFAEAGFATFHDGARREDFNQGVEDKRFALVHRQRRNLHDEDVGIFVDDEAAQKIALGVDDAKGVSFGQMPFSDVEGGADATDKKGEVDLDLFRRNHADADLGLGIVKADAKESLAMVFDLDEHAVFRRSGEADDGTGIDPRMTGNNAIGFAWT